jgi:hypothetical protein
MEGLTKNWSPEKKEQRELFRASVGFDFIFIKDELGRKKALCIELNGQETGVFGFAELKDQDMTSQIVAGIRTRYDEEHMRAGRESVRLKEMLKSNSIEEQTGAIDLLLEQPKRDVILQKKHMIKHAFENPAIIEDIANDKHKQEAVIPEESRPAFWHEESPSSSTGYFIIKPRRSRGGKGIIVLKQDQLQETLEKGKEALGFLKFEDNFVVQDFYFALGADNATDTYKDNPASLRLLIDFQYMEDGSIKKIQQVAYQRVSPHKSGKNQETLNENNIVNKSREAVAVAASKDEVSLASQVAEEIIKNLGTVYQKS